VSALSGRTALVTGGGRGIGLEVCRQLAAQGARVWLTARDLDHAARCAAGLRADADVLAAQLDVTDEASVGRLAGQVSRLDILVNNAGTDYDADQRAVSVPLGRVRRAMETNLFGAWRTAQAFAPHLRASGHGRLVNVSSEGGSITEMGGGTPGYRVAKLALNGLTRMLADELASDRVLVNSVCPGWTDTDMGRGGRPVAAGARSVTWACTLDDDGPSGGFFRDGTPLPLLPALAGPVEGAAWRPRPVLSRRAPTPLRRVR
jgi:NAD(P)-dependent dehydrogenase (short-subunit alcohol dehydrogenase family)